MVDLTLIGIEAIKVVIQLTLGGLLLVPWLKAKRKYFSDLPFLLGIVLLGVGFGELFDVLMDSNILVETVEMYRLRLCVLLVGLEAMIYAISIIWFRKRKNARMLFRVVYPVAYIVGIFWFNTIESVLQFVSLMIISAIIPLILTFAIAWRLQRLPSVHGLLVALGATIIAIGQLIEPVLRIYNALALAELIDIFGWTTVFASVRIRPDYAINKNENITIKNTTYH